MTGKSNVVEKVVMVPQFGMSKENHFSGKGKSKKRKYYSDSQHFAFAGREAVKLSPVGRRVHRRH